MKSKEKGNETWAALFLALFCCAVLAEFYVAPWLMFVFLGLIGVEFIVLTRR